MSNLSAKERAQLPLSSFGCPDQRKFPIVDASDVADAAGLLGRAKGCDPEKTKARIINIAKRRGFAIPDAWKED